MSNNINDVNKYIETTIENKMNDLIQSLKIHNNNSNTDKPLNKNDIINNSISDIYKNTIQTIIDIINEIMIIIDNSSFNNNYNYNYYYNIIYVFFKENRMFYIGIILIILSFVIYFIDN